MDIGELKQAILATDPAAVLVPPRILRRLFQAEFHVPSLLLHAPHERCYVFDRQVLFDHVDQEELDLEPDRLLPPVVILLARPSADQEENLDRDATLLRYWQLLFHAHVHLELRRRRQEGKLTATDIRNRVAQLGQTQFEEIRTVLEQEHYLLPPHDEATVYTEFAAVYLELKYFRPNLRPTYFPALGDLAAVDRLLAQDVDGDALFARTRLPGAPDPVVRTDTSSDESHDYYYKLLRHAQRANDEGDVVRAAILRTRAARVAPASLTRQTRADAFRDLQTLTAQLQAALKLRDEDVRGWLEVLPALLDKADQGNWPVEARLLLDLQNASLEPTRKLFALDLVEWALSAGKRPIKRPLTGLPIVRVARHLRSATQRLTMARVSDEERQRLAKLLQDALRQSEERVRERFRPILRDAFADVGLTASSPPEQVALDKMIEEVLDRITEHGFFTFSDLRDIISGNQLKLPDLGDPHAFWRGDPLLRLDRRLATLLEGVYRRGEFYLRWLESSSSLFFGTPLGRFLTLNLIVPFGGAFILLKAIEACLRDYANWDPELPGYTFLLVGAFILGLIRVDRLREAIMNVGAQAYRGLRFVFYETPRWLWQRPILHAVLTSWPFLLLYWYVLKPMVVWGLLYLYSPEVFGSPPAAVVTFIVADVLINSRIGWAVSEALSEMVELAYFWVRFDLFRGLVRLVSGFFKRLTEGLEYVLYSVDEWLRFRSGESRLQNALRAVLGVLWFPIGYLIRLYFVVLIEPSINPIKLPISSLAFKVMLLLPLYQQLIFSPATYEGHLTPRLGWWTSTVLAVPVLWLTLWLLPGAFSFFIWEMKENWRLFRANRRAALGPVVVGRHGETILQLLRQGFHSGTIPRLFAHLRHAESAAYRTGNWRSARAYRQALREVARSVQLFVEREFIALLHQSPAWADQPVTVAQVILSCNCIRVDLCHAAYPGENARLTFEERAGWLIGGLEAPGWLARLTPLQAQVLGAALTGLYKLAGVDFFREELTRVVTADARGFDLTGDDLVVWLDHRDDRQVAYDLRSKNGLLRPRAPDGHEVPGLPVVDARRLFFSRVPLTWQQWVACWQNGCIGQGPPPALAERLVPLSLPVAHEA